MPSYIIHYRQGQTANGFIVMPGTLFRFRQRTQSDNTPAALRYFLLYIAGKL